MNALRLFCAMATAEQMEAVNDRIEALTAVTERHAEMIEELKAQVGELMDKNTEKTVKRTLTEGKGFLGLPIYTGKLEEYDDWNFKVRNYVEEHMKEYQLLFNYLEGETEEVAQAGVLPNMGKHSISCFLA